MAPLSRVSLASRAFEWLWRSVIFNFAYRAFAENIFHALFHPSENDLLSCGRAKNTQRLLICIQMSLQRFQSRWTVAWIFCTVQQSAFCYRFFHSDIRLLANLLNVSRMKQSPRRQYYPNCWSSLLLLRESNDARKTLISPEKPLTYDGFMSAINNFQLVSSCADSVWWDVGMASTRRVKHSQGKVAR